MADGAGAPTDRMSDFVAGRPRARAARCGGRRVRRGGRRRRDRTRPPSRRAASPRWPSGFGPAARSSPACRTSATGTPRARTAAGLFDYDQRGILDAHPPALLHPALVPAAWHTRSGLEPCGHRHTGLPFDALGVHTDRSIGRVGSLVDRALRARLADDVRLPVRVRAGSRAPRSMWRPTSATDPHELAARRAARWVTIAATALFTLMVCGWQPWHLFARAGFSSDFYDEQARSFLRGRLSVRPEVAGIEGFVVDGATYFYYGPFLAVVAPAVRAVRRRVRRTAVAAVARRRPSSRGARRRSTWSRWLGDGRPSAGTRRSPRWHRRGAPARSSPLPPPRRPCSCPGWISVYHETELWAATFALWAAVGSVRLAIEPSRRVAWLTAAAVVATHHHPGIGGAGRGHRRRPGGAAVLAARPGGRRHRDRRVRRRRRRCRPRSTGPGSGRPPHCPPNCRCSRPSTPIVRHGSQGTTAASSACGSCRPRSPSTCGPTPCASNDSCRSCGTDHSPATTGRTRSSRSRPPRRSPTPRRCCASPR